MGNPYVVQDFPAIENYVCAFSNATVSETAAVKAIFGEIPISGHLPVTIPGIASRGEGIERPAPANSGSTQLRRFLPCSTVKWPATKRLSRSVIARLSLGALFAALCVLPACSINTNDKGKDGEKHVDIKSPMGDLHVSEQADIRDAGLTLYPGAKPAPKDTSDDKKSANVNLSVPGFSLKVVAAEFISDDAPDKIVAYYDKELQKYGKPIQCHGAWSGRPRKNGKLARMKCPSPFRATADSGGDSVELKVGTEGNQHVVAVKPNNPGERAASADEEKEKARQAPAASRPGRRARGRARRRRFPPPPPGFVCRLRQTKTAPAERRPRSRALSLVRHSAANYALAGPRAWPANFITSTSSSAFPIPAGTIRVHHRPRGPSSCSQRGNMPSHEQVHPLAHRDGYSFRLAAKRR